VPRPFIVNGCDAFDIMAFDTSRSAALSWQFPTPRWAQGHSTGSTNSEWRRSWRRLYLWRTEEIARQLTEYWASVPQQDKDALVAWNLVQVNRYNALASFAPCATEHQVRAFFDSGVSAIHRDAVSNHNGQPLPSDAHSVIEHWYPNIVYGESDYLLLSRATQRVRGVCEAKSPWNVGPAQIDQVILGITMTVCL